MKQLIFILLILLTACQSSKPTVIKTTTTETITETVHDTVFEIKADSSFYKAYIKCINNKPVISKPESKPGKNIKAPKVNLKDSTLTVDCEVEAQKLFAEWKSKHTTKDTVTEVPVFIDKDFTFWQKIQLWLGRIVLVLMLIAVCYFLIKTYTKIGL